MRLEHFRLERVRLITGDAPDVRDIAYPPPRWKHEESFWNDGLRFDIWVNWDNRVRIEHDGVVVLQMWAPAGEIIRAIDARRKANHGRE